MRDAYSCVFAKYQFALGHYFRHLYHILLFIKNSEDDELQLLKNKSANSIQTVKTKYKKFADLLQSQLSSHELFVLFFNALSFKNLYYLIIHYDFLENLSLEDLIEKNHASVYNGYSEDGDLKYEMPFKSRGNLTDYF